LITGGSGFVAARLILHLIETTPHEVVALDALTYAGNLENLAGLIDHERLSFVHGDIRDEELVNRVVADVDVVVHTAANSHVAQSIAEGAREFLSVNVDGTRVFLDAIRANPVERFILLSSNEVYGTARYDPIDEEHALDPRSPYAASKVAADRLAYSYHVTYGLPIVTIRPFTNFGPFQHPEKMIPKFIVQALLDEPITIQGDGSATRDWVFVDDHAEAIRCAIDADVDTVAGEAINVATGRGMSVAEIADLVLGLLDKPSTLKVHTEDRPGQVARNVGSPAKAARLLGWRPQTSFEDGLERTAAWYGQNRAWWQAILGAQAGALRS
jgi:dTDP-glucose 4,6-dehydratase